MQDLPNMASLIPELLEVAKMLHLLSGEIKHPIALKPVIQKRIKLIICFQLIFGTHHIIFLSKKQTVSYPRQTDNPLRFNKPIVTKWISVILLKSEDFHYQKNFTLENLAMIISLPLYKSRYHCILGPPLCILACCAIK
jgi:hypothetical protein